LGTVPLSLILCKVRRNKDLALDWPCRRGG
jgi:hypothetical protein